MPLPSSPQLERLASGLFAVWVDGVDVGTAFRVGGGWRSERRDGTRVGWTDASSLADAVDRLANAARAERDEASIEAQYREAYGDEYAGLATYQHEGR